MSSRSCHFSQARARGSATVLRTILPVVRSETGFAIYSINSNSDGRSGRAFETKLSGYWICVCRCRCRQTDRSRHAKSHSPDLVSRTRTARPAIVTNRDYRKVRSLLETATYSHSPSDFNSVQPCSELDRELDKYWIPIDSEPGDYYPAAD